MKKLNFTDVLFLASLTLSLLWILQLMKGSSFFFDEWDFVLHRGLNVNDLLRPHNGHFSVLPVLVFISLRQVFGISSYLPFQIVSLLVHATVCIGVYAAIRSRSKNLAFACGLLAVLLGAGWQNILWPFQIGMMGAFSAGLWAILELNRDDVRPWRVSLLVAVSLSCAGGGIAIAAVVGIVVFFGRMWRVARALAPTFILYALWYLKYGVSQSQDGNLVKVPRYVLDSALASAAGVGGRSLIFGSAVVGVLLVLFIQNMKLQKWSSPANQFFAFLLVTWLLTGLSRAHLGEPGASRYVYVGAITLIVIAGLLLPSINSWKSLFLTTSIFIFLVLPNVDTMKAGANGLRDTSLHLSAEQAAIEQLDVPVSSKFVIDTARAPQLDTGGYLRVAKRFGSPAMKWTKVLTAPETVIADVNKTLFSATNVLRKTDRLQCDSSSVQGVLEFEENQELVIHIPKSVRLTFNWINSDANSSFAVDVAEAGVYSILNPDFKEPLTLTVSGDLQSIELCNQ